MTSDRILTLPNVISFIRLLAIPFFLWLLLAERDYLWAGIMLGVIGATDWVDGWLARRLGQVSELGKALDPVADRLALFAAVVGGWIAGVLPTVLVVALVVREVAMAIGTAVLKARRGEQLSVRWLGKAATLLLYAAIPGFFFAAAEQLPDGLREFFYWGAWVTGVVGTVLYYVVAVQYWREIVQRLGAPETSG
jgi:cardiolipin synthase